MPKRQGRTQHRGGRHGKAAALRRRRVRVRRNDQRGGRGRGHGTSRSACQAGAWSHGPRASTSRREHPHRDPRRLIRQLRAATVVGSSRGAGPDVTSGASARQCWPESGRPWRHAGDLLRETPGRMRGKPDAIGRWPRRWAAGRAFHPLRHVSESRASARVRSTPASGCGSRTAVEELQQMLREGLRIKDVGDVLLPRQHQQSRVG